MMIPPAARVGNLRVARARSAMLAATLSELMHEYAAMVERSDLSAIAPTSAAALARAAQALSEEVHALPPLPTPAGEGGAL